MNTPQTWPARNHFIQWKGCEKEFVTRQIAIDTVIGCAAVNVRDLSIGNKVELIGDLSNDAYFEHIGGLVKQHGLTPTQKRLGLKNLLPNIHAEASNLWSEVQIMPDSVEIGGAIMVWPEFRQGFGKRLRVVYCVQCSEIDDATSEDPTLRGALLDAALRLERRRVLSFFREWHLQA